MRTRRHIYEAATPAFPESLTTPRSIVQALPASATKSCNAKARGRNGGEPKQKKKKKCTGGLWDKQIPTDLLQEILSRLGLKANIHVSLVCKTWLKAAVSIRKLKSRPWLFYPQRGSEDGDYLLFDPSSSRTYQLKFPELKNHTFTCSRDGWLLVKKDSFFDSVFFLNPFTGERIYLPKAQRPFSTYALTFSAAPTSPSCCVISFIFQIADVFFVFETWRPGDSEWTIRYFLNKSYGSGTVRCLFSNGVFYCLSTTGNLSVFDPLETTWTILPVKPCPLFTHRRAKTPRSVFMTEHEGDIFLVTSRGTNNSRLLVFKLNLELNLWEEVRAGLAELTLFSCFGASFTRAGLSAEERNKLYTSLVGDYGKRGIYYFGCAGCTPPYSTYLSIRSAWLEPPPPPHNNLSL